MITAMNMLYAVLGRGGGGRGDGRVLPFIVTSFAS